MSRPATLALLSALALGSPVIAAAAPQRPVAAQVATAPSAPAPAAASDTSGYAQREQQDKQVASYEGGNTIVIGISSGALVVLLIILLLI